MLYVSHRLLHDRLGNQSAEKSLQIRRISILQQVLFAAGLALVFKQEFKDELDFIIDSVVQMIKDRIFI